MTYLSNTSILIPSQIPSWIVDDPSYATFISFMEAYYEWMQEQGNVINSSKSLLSYADIDTTLDEFVSYFRNDFLSFFPENALVNERLLIKLSNQIYKAKGTVAAYEFLFRVLYNSDVNIYNAKDYVLKTSDGKWIVTKYINIDSIDPAWQLYVGYKIFGETSKSYAVIEDVVIGLTSSEIILTSIQGSFISGEIVGVIDNTYTTLIQAEILGLVQSVVVDPSYQGYGYNVGDPVVFYGGINPNSNNTVSASAYISKVSGASVASINPVYRGQGYRQGSFTQININSGSGTGSNASAVATNFDYANPYYLQLIPDDTIAPKASISLSSGSYNFANLISANINTTLTQALSFPVLNTFGILSTTITSVGSGYDQTTTANATGFFATDVYSIEPIYKQGILAPIIIVNGGIGYHVNDTIIFSGGRGYGAHANVTSVAANGKILEISYVQDSSKKTAYPLGGMGYTPDDLPTVSVNSSNGSGALIQLPGLVGLDATFSIGITTYGEVQEITLTSAGKGYSTSPSVSLRIEDWLVHNVDVSNQPLKGDKAYQGTLSDTTFIANVDSLLIVSSNTNTLLNDYNLRIYNFDGLFDSNSSIKIMRNGVDTGMNLLLSKKTTGIYNGGIKTYGNGAARAIANFASGTLSGKGFYLNADGFPSGYSVLEGEHYNAYTYILQVERALSDYKQTALRLLHPSGTNYDAINLLKNEQQFNTNITDNELIVQPLSYLFGTDRYIANSVTTSNNTTIYFTNLSGANVANAIAVNSFVTLYTNSGRPYYSGVKATSPTTITLQDRWNITVPNVAYAYANANSNIININTITNSWNIATGESVNYISDFMDVYDSVSFDGIHYNMITHVDQPGYGTRIFVNSVFQTAQTGLLILSSNVISSNIWVSGVLSFPEQVDILTEFGIPMTTEGGSILILG
jgi:hypothetical protein